MSIRIIIADDHKIIREGLRSMIDRQDHMVVVAEADNGRGLLGLVREFSPDVIIMDVAMPELNGMEATRQVLAQYPRLKVLALSMHADRRFVTGMLSAGAAGYLLKDCAFEELTRAIETVVANKVYLSPGITETVVGDYLDRLSQADAPSGPSLTAREREVLQLMAEGHTTKEIAQNLHLSAKTVETHRRQIMEKLDIHSVAELTKWAVREGLTSLEG